VPYRSVYLPMARSAVLDVMTIFDMPDPNLVTGARQSTIVPTQSLFLMNSPLALSASRAAAERLLADTPGQSDLDRIAIAFERLFGRLPTEEERAAMSEFLTPPDPADPLTLWAQALQALMVSGEFRTVY